MFDVKEDWTHRLEPLDNFVNVVESLVISKCYYVSHLSSDEKSLKLGSGTFIASLVSQIAFQIVLSVLSTLESNSKIRESTPRIKQLKGI